MERALRTLGIALAFGTALAACSRAENARTPRPNAPNLLVITIDTLRADRVGSYGDSRAQTPALDELAARGVRFETAIAGAPTTLPSHASIFTGLHPPRHGTRFNGIYVLAPKFETLAERLQQAGYATGAAVGAFVLARRFGLDQGFDAYDDRMTSKHATAGGYLERRASEVTDRALEWLRDTSPPFFLWVHYYDPHQTHEPPPAFASRFAGDLYAGEIAYVDSELKRLLTELHKAGHFENTLVVATSDHGEGLGEHGENTHGYTLYDSTLRVPLIFCGPGLPWGRAVQGIVRTVDIAPTLLALLDLPPLKDGDGKDLAPLWQIKAKPAQRAAYAETLATELEHGWSPLFAIRTRDYHYVRAPRPELYDLRSDPKQLHNLLTATKTEQLHATTQSGDTATVVASLDAEIGRVLAQSTQQNTRTIDEKTREQLAALGYVVVNPMATTSIIQAMDPKDGLQWLATYDQALVYFHAHRFPEAKRALQTLLHHVPTSASGHALMARTLVLMGQIENALPHAEAAQRLRPEAAEHGIILGDARLLLKNEAGAEEAYRAAAKRAPDDPQVEASLVWLAWRKGNEKQADRHAKRALALAPESPELLARLGNFWERLGEYERALENYREMLRIDPASSEAHMNLAIQLARLDRDHEVQTHLARAGSAAEVPHFRNRLAIVYAARGDIDKAEAIFRDLMQKHPDYASARQNLITLLLRAGRAGEAAALAQTSAPR